MDREDQLDLQTRQDDAHPCKYETGAVLGCAFEVLNTLGHGLKETCYENSLVVDFKHQGIAFDQQQRFDVLYKGEAVGEFIPDLIAFRSVIVDAKCIDRITDHERGQMLNYLKITGLPVGLILNFKRPRLEWERVVLTPGDKLNLRGGSPQTDADNDQRPRS